MWRLIGFDYTGMKPTMAVREGDRVKRGSLLFTDKKTEGVRYTSPAAGTVKVINRGERRVFQSVVIEIDGDEAETFARYGEGDLDNLDRQQVVDNLVESGLVDGVPHPALQQGAGHRQRTAFHFCHGHGHPSAGCGPRGDHQQRSQGVRKWPAYYPQADPGFGFCLHQARRQGAHAQAREPGAGNTFPAPIPQATPALTSTFLTPSWGSKVVWTIGYQDVMAIGRLFLTGELPVERVVALGGPMVHKPRLLRTRMGASMDELLDGEVESGAELRVISGSVFGGRTARGACGYLGRFANQITVLQEGRQRDLFALSVTGYPALLGNEYLSVQTDGRQAVQLHHQHQRQ